MELGWKPKMDKKKWKNNNARSIALGRKTLASGSSFNS
jgi:hypothetical protein